MTASGQLFNPDGFSEPDSPPSSGSKVDPEHSEPDGVAVRVLPDVSGLDKEFDYLALAADVERLSVGSLVRIELNRRHVGGWVTAIGSDRPEGIRLRPLSKVSSVGPSAEIVDLARWAARRWGGRVAPILKTASPPRMVAGLPDPTPADLPPGSAGPTSESPGATGPADAFAGAGVSVVRLGPNDDPLPWLIAASEQGSSLVIAPRLGLARTLAGRLRQRGVNARVHPRDWSAAAGRGGLVLGARSAVWTRVANLRSIVVFDEHDDALQEERNPTWHAREVAIERARRAGIPCVLISPAPSLAALAATDTLIETSRTAERRGWPVVEIVDRRDDEPGRSGLFSSRVAQLVQGTGSVLAVLNRKGRAVMLACATCGELAKTEDGERLMVERDGQLVSPATGETRPLVCPFCGATSMKRLRLGVTRAAEELAALAGEPVDEVSAGSADRRSTSRIVVGTEAALHQLVQVDVVVFLDFDQELMAPRYRAGEQAMSLLILAARLVGGRNDGGRIVVQTRSPDHRVLEAAVRADPGRLAAEEQPLRRRLGMPPFGALAELSGAGAAEYARRLEARSATVLGPRDDGRYLLRADHPDELADLIADTERPNERVRIAVDPPRA